uniref:Protein lines-like isoform X2 n=1 Tax=Hirondellea gigas TaxID=1518452 RepID=A0A6A7G228_9CRUS
MQACSSSQQNENISERQPSHSADQQQVRYDLINQQSHECSRVQRTKCMQENLLENFKNVNCTVTNPNCVELKDPNTDTSTEQVKNQISYLYIDNYKSAANNCDNVHEKNVNVARTTNGGPVNCIQTPSSHIYSIAMKDTTKDVNLDSLQNLHNIQSQDESVNCSKRHKTSNGCNSCCGTKVSQYCTALQLTHHYQSAHSSQHIATSKLASLSSASQPHLRNSSLDTPIRNSLTLEKGDNEDAGPEFPLTPPSESIADSGDEYDLQEVINKVDMPLMVAQTFRGSDGSTNPYLGKDRTNSPTKFDFSSSVYNKIDSSTNTIDNTCTSASCSSSYAPSANIKNNLNSGDSLRNESMNDIECSSHSNSDNVIASNNLQQSLDGLQMLQDCYGECGDSDGEGSGSVHSDDKRRKLSLSVDNLQQEQLVQSNTLLRTNSLNNFMLNSCSGNSIPSNANNLMINTGVSVQNRPYDTSSKNVNTIIRTNSNAVMCNAISADDLRVDDSSPMCVNSNSDLISHCNLIKFDGRGTISYQESGAKKVQTNIITCSSRTQSVHNHSSLSTNEHLLGSCSVNKGTDDCVVSSSGKTIAATRCKSSIGNLEAPAPIQTTKDVKHNALLSNSGSAVPSSSADNERSQQCIEEPTMSCSSSAGECNTQNSSSDAAAVPGNSERHLRVVVFRKTVLLLLKAIAVTVKEARGDGESSSSSSESSSPRSGAGGSETEQMDMEIIGRSLKEALQKIDSFVKGREAYHPHCPMAEWLVKLFSCQDDWMVEAMVCGLDIYSVLGNSVRGVSVHLGAWLCPHTSFLTFLDTVRYDSSVMVALLVSNETCFLLYLLRYLKVAKRSWLSLDQVSSFTNSNVNTRLAVEAMQQLRDSINSLVANGEFPYNISPVLQLLDHCHQLFAATLS